MTEPIFPSGPWIGFYNYRPGERHRMDLHLTRLHDAANWANSAATETLANMAQRFSGSDAQLMALKQMNAFVRMQAAVMSYADVFLMLTALFLGLAALGLLMKRPAAQVGAEAGH